MRVLVIFLLTLFTTPVYAFDLGDGPFIDCSLLLKGGSTPDNEFNCTDLVIDGINTFTSTSNIIIRVEGDVTILGELNVSSLGRPANSGGFEGGTGGTNNNGNNGLAPTDFPNARGNGGQAGSNDLSPIDECSGAAGSGGRHAQLDTPGNGDSVTNAGFSCNATANGGLAATQSYGSPTNLHQQIFGGSGGGGGGGGSDSGGSFVQGGSGGGGGGVIIIYSGGDIILNGASLIANGANGADGTTIIPGFASGPGGGGAGGAILLSSLGIVEIISASSIETIGGFGGTNSVGLNGSDGARGVIRIEDKDGDIDLTLLTSNPPVSTGQNPVAAAQASGQGSTLNLSSDLSAGCALREIQENYNYFPLILMIFIFSLGSIQKNQSLKSRAHQDIQILNL